MTWIDASDYFAAVEARQEPCTLTREDMVILALAGKTRTPGYCAACGDPVKTNGFYRWCPECRIVADRFMALRGMQRYHHGATQKTCKCGKPVSKGNSAYRCDECQRDARLEACRDYWRRSQGQGAMA